MLKFVVNALAGFCCIFLAFLVGRVYFVAWMPFLLVVATVVVCGAWACLDYGRGSAFQLAVATMGLPVGLMMPTWGGNPMALRFGFAVGALVLLARAASLTTFKPRRAS